MLSQDFDYFLPPELIAQHPAEKRDESRLLAYDPENDALSEGHFNDLKNYLKPGDLLVMNNSRVRAARLTAWRQTGGAAEVFLLRPTEEAQVWQTLLRPGRRLPEGSTLSFGDLPLRAEVGGRLPDGVRLVRFESLDPSIPLDALLEKAGEIPLPPYIHESLEDPERYQTVYADPLGSVAAPTAGLHFTPELLVELEDMGVELCYLTLHVGLGTFRPVNSDTVEGHHMHTEAYEVSEKAAEQINRAKAEGRRIVAVGTTSCRTLESLGQKKGPYTACTGETDIFIYPGYRFQLVDALITNFHLPQSTLLMLLSAFVGYQKWRHCYAYAIEQGFRFYSFGDAMFVLRNTQADQDLPPSAQASATSKR